MSTLARTLDEATLKELVAVRRDLHQHPETAFEEVRTADLVASTLQSWGITVHRGLAKTGVVATIEGKRPGQRTIALRADMDALHLQENNEFEHRSIVDGKQYDAAYPARLKETIY